MVNEKNFTNKAGEKNVIKKRKLVMWGWFGFKNCGDDLLMLDTYEHIKQKSSYEIIIFGKEKNIMEVFGIKKVKCTKRTPLNGLLWACRADFFLIGPGGLFPSKNTIKLLFYDVLVFLIKLRRKKIVFMGIDFANCIFEKKIDQMFLNYLIKNADAFSLRSSNYLQCKNLYKDKIIDSADVIFSNKKLRDIKIEKNNKLITVSLANIFSRKQTKQKEKFVLEITHFLMSILNEGYNINLISFTDERDNLLNAEICNIVNDSRVQCIAYKNPYDTFRELSKGKICVAMRYHAFIMSLIANIPSVTISYGDKTNDLLRRMDLLEYSMKYGVSTNEYFNEKISISSTKLKHLFDAVKGDYEEIKYRIEKNIEKIIEKSKRNYEVLDKEL